MLELLQSAQRTVLLKLLEVLVVLRLWVRQKRLQLLGLLKLLELLEVLKMEVPLWLRVLLELMEWQQPAFLFRRFLYLMASLLKQAQLAWKLLHQFY